MAEFEIQIHNIKSIISKEKSIAYKLETAGNSIEECGRLLDTSVSNQYGEIKKTLTKLSEHLSDYTESIRSMETALSEISAVYKTAEKGLCEDVISYTDANVEKTNAFSEKLLTKSGVSKGLSIASKIIKTANDKAQNKQAKALASMFSMIKSGVSLSEAEGVTETYTAYASFTGATLGFGSKLGKSISDLIEKYGTDSAQKWKKKIAKS